MNARKAVFQGKEDYFTPIGELEIFQNSGNKDLEVFLYEKLGHCFSPNREGMTTFGPIDSIVINDILNTILKWGH